MTSIDDSLVLQAAATFGVPGPVARELIDSDGPRTPRITAFLDADGADEALDGFKDAVLDLAFGGKHPGVCVRIGGFPDPWDTVPDEDSLSLFTQIAGQAIDHNVFTMNLIMGASEDIAAQRYSRLRYEQQC